MNNSLKSDKKLTAISHNQKNFSKLSIKNQKINLSIQKMFTAMFVIRKLRLVILSNTGVGCVGRELVMIVLSEKGKSMKKQ